MKIKSIVSGILEVYFFAEDDTADHAAGTFYVYTYDVQKGEPVAAVTCKKIAYDSEDGGEYIIYVTYHNELVVIHTASEGSVKHIYTDVYDPSFNLKYSFRRDESDKGITYYENNKKVDQSVYETTLTMYMNDVNAILMNGMEPEDDDFEEPLNHYGRFLSYSASDMVFELTILLNQYHNSY